MIKSKVESSSLLDTVDGKTISPFTAESSYGYNLYYIKHDTDEVTMTLTNGGGFEFKKISDGGVITLDHTKLMLFKRDDNKAATAGTQIPMSGIKMIRQLSEFENHILWNSESWNSQNKNFHLADDQKVKQGYTEPDSKEYKMSVLVQKYYEGDTEKTPTETNAATQDVKFIFPEEKKDKLQDGGIKIRYS